jgi:hypothetical protein
MFTRTLLTTAALTVTLAARADDVTLTSIAPPGTPLTVNPGAVSAPVLLQISNTSSPQTTSLAALQVSLVIAPIGTTTGSVTFNSPTTQTFTPPAGQPPSYFLNGNSAGIDVVNSGTTLRANDFANTAALIPPGPSNLFQFDLLASPDATGTFGVYAVRGPGETLYTDGTPSDAFFTNVANGAGTVQLAEVFVPVPEPAGLLAAGVAGLLAAGWVRRRFAKNS